MSELGVAASGLKGEVITRELERFERTVARRSAEIRATVPSIELTAVVAVDGALASGVSLDALVVQAAAVALRAVPRANGSYRDGKYETYSRVNIGIVVADEEGTYAIPTVFDADSKSAAELEAELADYSERVRAGELASAEQTGATFTLSLPPGDAVTTVAPLIMAPQAAALGWAAFSRLRLFVMGPLSPGRRSPWHYLATTESCSQYTAPPSLRRSSASWRACDDP